MNAGEFRLLFEGKMVPGDRTERFLAEIERAEWIFKRMCERGDFDDDIHTVRATRKVAGEMRRIMRQ